MILSNSWCHGVLQPTCTHLRPALSLSLLCSWLSPLKLLEKEKFTLSLHQIGLRAGDISEGELNRGVGGWEGTSSFESTPNVPNTSTPQGSTHWIDSLNRLVEAQKSSKSLLYTKANKMSLIMSAAFTWWSVSIYLAQSNAKEWHYVLLEVS